MFFKKLIFILLLCIAYAAQAQKAQIVFCTDLSGSTNGMLIGLQNTVWSTANNIATSKSLSSLEFGFVGFGRKSFGEENHFSKVISDLTPDINEIGYHLLKSQLTIEGCVAYPQKAIHDAVNQISWSKEENVEKIIIMIGNGGIPQKQMEKEIKKAIKLGIKIKPIYYSPENKIKDIEAWKEFAEMCNNELEISNALNTKVKFITNYDSDFLVSAGNDLLNTYIPYGENGLRSHKKFEYIFNNLKETNTNNYEQMLCYLTNSNNIGFQKDWDLVDLAMRESVNFDKLDRSKLHLFLNSFSNDQLKKYVELKVKERKILIEKIRLEQSKRAAYQNKILVKSENLADKGGLNLIVQNYINSELSKFQLTSLVIK